ncbi:MAG: hypothetical protein FRX49_09505 [Trebouxia sp. A1-2]|nr:MAG: hypothetical protein FRX49_09505 [Trebouxia sp. A1-2]
MASLQASVCQRQLVTQVKINTGTWGETSGSHLLARSIPQPGSQAQAQSIGLNNKMSHQPTFFSFSRLTVEANGSARPLTEAGGGIWKEASQRGLLSDEPCQPDSARPTWPQNIPQGPTALAPPAHELSQVWCAIQLQQARQDAQQDLTVGKGSDTRKGFQVAYISPPCSWVRLIYPRAWYKQRFVKVAAYAYDYTSAPVGDTTAPVGDAPAPVRDTAAHVPFRLQNIMQHMTLTSLRFAVAASGRAYVTCQIGPNALAGGGGGG